MKIKTFADIRDIDVELADFFLRPEEAVHWINTVSKEMKEWISKRNKGHWEIVKYATEKRGILGKRKKNGDIAKLTRKEFAKVLITFCPEALNEDETESKLVSSMEHYIMENAYRLGPSGTSLARVREVEALLDSHQMEEDEADDEPPSMVDLMSYFLKKEIRDEGSHHGGRSSALFFRKQYGNGIPALSVETYLSDDLRKKQLYSGVEAYEFVEEELTPSKLYELIGKYNSVPKLRLFVVSLMGLRPDVCHLARANNVGYVRLNPSHNPEKPEYILPRSVDNYDKKRQAQDVLFGIAAMTSPILIMDADNITTSLADVLSKHGVAVQSNIMLEVPYLEKKAIESMANRLSEPFVEGCLDIFRSWDENLSCSVDPFAIAHDKGLAYETSHLSDNLTLGRLDVAKRQVTLNSSGLSNYNRYRFTMAHELGHFLLHVPLYKRCGEVSLQESDKTLTSTKNITDFQQRRLEYQANLFASYLLMPKKLVCALYGHFYEMYVHQRYGDPLQALYYNPRQPETIPSYHHVVMNMARALKVSQEALVIRLKSLHLLKMPD